MADQPTENAPAAVPAASGGIKAWLPLIVTVVAMPALAYGTMSFLILPKMRAVTVGAPSGEPAGAVEGEGGHGSEGGGSEGADSHAEPGKASSRKGQVQARLDKVVVNVAGTMGTRFLMASVTLVGSKSSFKDTVETNKDQLMDLATSTLSGKTIADLEKPGARNLIKTELISVFNHALGEGLVQEIYIPEMAIQ